MTSTINTSNSNESTTVSNHSGETIAYTAVEKTPGLDDNVDKNHVALTIETASAAALSKKRGITETTLVTTKVEDLTGNNNDDVGNNDDPDGISIGERCKDEKEALLTDESSVIVDKQHRDPSLQSNDTIMTTPPENENEEAVAIAIDIQRPIKRARTAYFLYLDDYRSTIQKENPGASVAVIARILGQRWSALSDENKQPYQKRALMERERVTAATEAWKKAAIAAGKSISSIASSKKDTDKTIQNNNDVGVASLVLPVGRVRKICRLDPDVRGISKEALLLITKMTEMVTIQLGTECIKTAHIQNRRTLLPQDIVDVCNIRESFFFLKDDITDLHRQQQKIQKATKQLQQQIGNTQRKGKASSTTTTTSTTTMKSMTDYFKPVA